MQLPPHGTRTVSEADFGRLKILDKLTPAQHSNAALEKLAVLMKSPPDPAKDGSDDEENPFVPAGYTYLGQFIDHDLTFDTHSVFDDPKSVERASNLRSPRFDLDNVYGRGPDDQPYIYNDPFDGTIILGDTLNTNVPDVQRNGQGRAIIGDPRNDENAIVVQLQSVFIRFHNRMIERAKAGKGTAKLTGKDAFLWAQLQTRQHYQRIILDDFLPRVIDMTSSTVSSIFSDLKRGKTPQLRLYDLDLPPYMPIEFAMAAYRFGHSMVRPGYRLSFLPGDVPLQKPDNVRVFDIFSGVNGGLRGFQRLDPGKGINWNLFFSTTPAGTPIDNSSPTTPNNKKGLGRTQLAYKIDTMIVDPLGHLPPAVAFSPSSLAERNLKRGRDFGLPSGQDAAGHVGANVLDDSLVSVRDQNAFDKRITLAEISPEFAHKAPLWAYVLAEAEQAVIAGVAAGKDPLELGTQLNGLGAAIVVETFVGLLLKDPESVLNPRTTWRSINGKPTFSIAEMLAEIGKPLT